MTVKIDLLKIDMAAGKQWMTRVLEDEEAAREVARHVRHRANWLRKHGRDAEAERLEAKHAALSDR